MRTIKYILFLNFLFISQLILAQAERILSVKVVDANNKVMKGVLVSVDGSKKVETDANGKLSIILSKRVSEPKVVEATYNDYNLQNWKFDEASKTLTIIMSPKPISLEGRVLDMSGKPIPNVDIQLEGFNSEEPVVTDEKGNFKLEIPFGSSIKKFIVAGKVFDNKNFTYNSKVNYVEIKVERSEVEGKDLAGGKFVKAEGNKPNITNEKEIEASENDPNVIAGLNPVLIVVVYDDDISPADSMSVLVDGKTYKTNSKGEFKLFTDSISNSIIEVPDFEIVKQQYNYEDNYMFIQIRDKNKTGDEIQDIEINVDENFESAFEQLESEKQLLQENGQEIRKEIMKITEKLEKEGNLSNDQKDRMEKYLQRLESALVDNELAYQNAKEKTHIMIEKIKDKIKSEDKEIQEIKKEKEFLEKIDIALIVLAVVMIVFSLVSYRLYLKTKRQHSELEKAHQELKDAQEEVIEGQKEMLAITEVGQNFTSTLDFEKHMSEVQQSIKALLPVDFFGIGVYDEIENALIFRGTQSKGQELPTYEKHLNDETSLSVWCFKNKEKIVINDYDNQYTQYVPAEKVKSKSEHRQSVIFLPLLIEEKPVGVITMQSYPKNVYQETHIAPLRMLASYAAIAVANSNAYRTIQKKNISITDSIRYAKTIQEAILPSKTWMSDLFKEYFVIFKPQAIVSGDFYWLYSTRDKYGMPRTFVAAVDCTGHGVPGALMSMIGNTVLNQIILQKSHNSTAEIMEDLDKGFKVALKQESDDASNDGAMDVCLCLLEKQNDGTTKINFTGAKRPLYYLPANSGKVTTITGDLKSVGGFHKNKRVFTTHELIVQKDDVIFLTTDGFIDQHSPTREKFGSLRFLKMLEDNDGKPMDAQKRTLEVALEMHQHNMEQRDDITVIGIRF
jgi:serine phosphatase RsbU (regulator of sigma subunit)